MSTLELDRPTDLDAPDARSSGAEPAGGALAPGAQPLTRRELVVLRHLAEDITLIELASTLFVSRNTIKSQVRSVYRKIGVNSRGEAVSWAYAAGLIDDAGL